MTAQDILTMLKASLEKRNTLNDDYIRDLIIPAAISEIQREGITLHTADVGAETDYTDLEEVNVIVMQAAYYYRQRASSTENYQTAALHPQGEPYMLRYAKNNLLFSQKMRAET